MKESGTKPQSPASPEGESRGLSRRQLLQGSLLATVFLGLGTGGAEARPRPQSAPPPRNAFRELGRFSPGLKELHGIAAASGQRIYVTGDQALLVMAGGKVLRRIGLSEPARCVATGPDDLVLLGMENHVEVWNAGGKREARWPSLPGDAILTGIAFVEGTVFVADAGSRTIVRYDLKGRQLGRFGGKKPSGGAPGFVIPSPYFDLAADPGGSLWVVNPGRHQLENYSLDGRFRSSWGEASSDPAGFCGCCNPIHIALLPDGRFVTSEKGIPRLKIYTQAGQLEQVLAGPEAFGEGATGFDLAVDAQGRILLLDPAGGQVRVYGTGATAPRGGRK